MMDHLLKNNPVSVRFLNRISKNEKISDDLYCTAISRCANKGEKIVIECAKHRCEGGNYFVGSKDVSRREIEDVYLNKEKVFRKTKDLKKFLKLSGRNPKKSKYIVFEPKISDRTDVVVLLLQPDSVGRVLGLSAYLGNFDVDIIPAASTCACVYRPLLKKRAVHVNFIDYFDRKFQCKSFFKKSQMIASMGLHVYKKMNKIFDQTSHGGIIPKNVPVYRVEKL